MRSPDFPYHEIKPKYDCDYCFDSGVITTGSELDVCPCYHEARSRERRERLDATYTPRRFDEHPDPKRFDVV